MDIQFSGFEIFAPKIEVAWAVLQRPYASHLTGRELDHPYACRACVVTKLPPDRTHVARHSVPEPTQPWDTDSRADRKPGIRVGRVRQELQNFDNGAGVNADPSVRRLARLPAC